MPEQPAQLRLGEQRRPAAPTRGCCRAATASRSQVVVLLRVVADVDLVTEREVAEVGRRSRRRGCAAGWSCRRRSARARAAARRDRGRTRRPRTPAARRSPSTGRVASMTVTPLGGGSGKRTRSVRSPGPTCDRCASSRAICFSLLCAIAALVALAPNRSTMVCSRAISFVCSIALLRQPLLVGGARRRGTGVYVPLYSTRCPVASSPGRSRCSTRVIASSSSSRSWLMTSSAPRYLRMNSSSHSLASMSRWLVGSSSSSTSLPANRIRDSSTRRRSPPDSTPMRQIEAVGLQTEAGGDAARLALGRVAARRGELVLRAAVAGDVAVAGVFLHREAQLLDADRAASSMPRPTARA